MSTKMGSLQGWSVVSSSPSIVVHLAHILIQSQSEFSRIWGGVCEDGEWGRCEGMVVDEEIAKQESESLPVVKWVNLVVGGGAAGTDVGDTGGRRAAAEDPGEEEKEQEGEEKDEMQRSESELESELWESSSEEGL
ncbi:hypothetical protein BLNAU_14212 [Blattamonas nauphoetae]|uniref:Uncharacterized protein n=1 Tax=Blattamonas nauphoetae TaxID=2049346 RepID=A0ABQ9XGI5_9EUKA|nr:hypothetical protein BLNAU_14212 [Blattamonas nauphoetae]